MVSVLNPSVLQQSARHFFLSLHSNSTQAISNSGYFRMCNDDTEGHGA